MTCHAHVLALGETQSGKSYGCNVLHAEFTSASIFVDTKRTDGLYGHHVSSLDGIASRLYQSRHLVWRPRHDLDSKKGMEAAMQELDVCTKELFRLGVEERKQWDQPWCQVVVDEAWRWAPEGAGGPVPRITREGLSHGVRAVCISQDAVGLDRGVIKNTPARLFWRMGEEGVFWLRSRGYPADWIEEWTRHPYHFVRKLPRQEWQRCTPV